MAPITSSDIISVKSNKLYYSNGTRFFVKGIAFPVPVEPDYYNATNWINILDQLHNTLSLPINTIRLYRLDPTVDYSSFFHAAAERGIYVIVPLTGATGRGDLSRTTPAPDCYPSKLFSYGVDALRNYAPHPNVLAGVVGNEVINTGVAWQAASCVKAYVRDLKSFQAADGGRALPLMYATQHSALGAGMNVSEAVRVTHDYFTCEEESTNRLGGGDDVGATAVDIFGVNIESWCSSLDTYETTEEGHEGTYLTIHEDLSGSSVPIVFTEMGCSHNDYNSGNDMGGNGTRDWNQVSVVLNEMADSFSGFCAYAYYGNDEFNMFSGGPWNGGPVPLEPTDDLYNFRDALNNYQNTTTTTTKILPKLSLSAVQSTPRMCSDVREELLTRFNIDVMDLKELPVRGEDWHDSSVTKSAAAFVATILMLVYVVKPFLRRSQYAKISDINV